MASEPKPTQEEVEQSFREGLKDVIEISQKLAPHCKDIAGLISICQLAMEHDDQLHLVMSLVTAPPAGRR